MRSAFQSRGSVAIGTVAKSTSLVPVVAHAARTASFIARMRGETKRASGTSAARSGSVNVSTVAPARRSSDCRRSTSAANAAASKRARSTSFVPENTVARSGRIASARSSCCSTRSRVVAPRTARLA